MLNNAELRQMQHDERNVNRKKMRLLNVVVGHQALQAT
jgi:hypothetical protein